MSCKNDKIVDRHHIIPRHNGGKSSPENLVSIKRTCHAMFHFCNWQRTGNKKDCIAWKGLVGQLSKQEIILFLSSEAGKKTFKERKGLYGLSKKERFIASSKGGKKASNYMSNSIWINNGDINKRIQKNSLIPNGFIKGRIKKLKNKNKSMYLSNLLKIRDNRISDIRLIDLSQRGSIAYLSRKWGISHTQVRRFIKKYFSV